MDDDPEQQTVRLARFIHHNKVYIHTVVICVEQLSDVSYLHVGHDTIQHTRSTRATYSLGKCHICQLVPVDYVNGKFMVARHLTHDVP